MIQKRNKNIIFRANNINLFFLILQLLFKQYFTDRCEGGLVNSLFYGLVECENICDNKGNPIYTKTFFVNDEHKCMQEIGQACKKPRILVKSTGECVSSCRHGYQIGDYCYFPNEMETFYGLKEKNPGIINKVCLDYTYYIKLK